MTFEAIVSFAKKYRNYIIAGALLLVLVGVSLWVWQATSNWWFNRSQNQKKAAVANTVKEIANIQTEISELDKKKTEKVGELKELTEDMNKEVLGREEAKKESNQAIANFIKAVNSNSNVDRTAEDIEAKLRELESQ